MEGRQLRDRDAIVIDLVGVAGLMAFVGGLVLLQDSEKIGFDPTAALDGVIGQLAVTLPAAILVLGATTLELAAGLVLARLMRTAPFTSVGEAAVAAFVAMVIKDTFLLGTLAAVGAFQAPLLIAIDVAIVAAGLWLTPVARTARPIVAVRWRDLPGGIGSWTIAVLVAVVWAGPTVLQLASPVVPFVDVLPNYVAPIEHLRTFGWFTPLTATQSPIYGPSRTVLGYDAMLGSIGTITDLSGALAVAAFILPLSVLVAAAAHLLARSLGARTVAIGPWALLAFALTQPFSRLADVRGTAVVVPLLCFGLALAAHAIRGDHGEERDGAVASATDRAVWRYGPGPAIGLALGSATLVHPVVGFFGIVTIAVAAMIRPRRLAAPALAAGVTAGLIAVPQLTTMIGSALPTPVLGILIAVAVVAGLLVARSLHRSPGATMAIVRLATIMRVVVPVVVIGGYVLALVVGPLEPERLPRTFAEGLGVVVESSGLLLIVLAVGVALGSPGARSPIVLVGLAVGAAALLFVGVLPTDLGYLGDGLRFELPKTVHYWLSTFAAVGAASGLAFAWGRARLPTTARGLLVAGFVVMAALPLRFGNSGDDRACTKDCTTINAYHLGEHRYAETFAISLHFAASGFWVGYPDPRTVVDEPRQALLAALRVEIDAGRLLHDTAVLHVASTFQQWKATPLGVFAGVTETSVSLDPERSQHTAGGRLFGVDDLPGFLASGEYRYVVLEPDGLPDGIRAQVEAAGYVEIFANAQGLVFRLDS